MSENRPAYGVEPRPTTTPAVEPISQPQRPVVSSWFMLDVADPELGLAWTTIQNRFGDVECLDPDTGEVWQYMGTVLMPAPLTGLSSWVHEFRHRSFVGTDRQGGWPINGERMFVRVPASAGWSR
jgi:hypothetical protein